MSNKKFDEWAFDQTVKKGGTIFGCKDKSGVNVGFVNTGTGEYFSLIDEWISVKDNPPKDQVVVNICGGDVEEYGLHPTSGYYDNSYGCFQAIADTGEVELMSAEYWQPLPKAKQQPTRKG